LPFPTLVSGQSDCCRHRQRNSHELERKRGQCRPQRRSRVLHHLRREADEDRLQGQAQARRPHVARAQGHGRAPRRGPEPGRIEAVADPRFEAEAAHRLGRLRVQDHVAEMVIGYAHKGMHRIYDQHRYLDGMREALCAWAVRLRTIVDPPPTNVMTLRTATGD
jgi:hypothetical protein